MSTMSSKLLEVAETELQELRTQANAAFDLYSDAMATLATTKSSYEALRVAVKQTQAVIDTLNGKAPPVEEVQPEPKKQQKKRAPKEDNPYAEYVCNGCGKKGSMSGGTTGGERPMRALICTCGHQVIA